MPPLFASEGHVQRRGTDVTPWLNDSQNATRGLDILQQPPTVEAEDGKQFKACPRCYSPVLTVSEGVFFIRTETMSKKKKTGAKKKTAAVERKKRTPRYVNMEKALKDIDAPFDRDVFAYIAGWVQPDGRTWPDSPTLKTIAHHVAPDAYSSRWAQYMVSFAVHDLEESGLLRIYRDYTQGDEHPRNIYMVNHCYMLDAAENNEPRNIERASARASFQKLGALGAIVESEGTASASENRSADILSKLADLLSDYHKKQEVLADVTLQRVTDFLQDALA